MNKLSGFNDYLKQIPGVSSAENIYNNVKPLMQPNGLSTTINNTLTGGENMVKGLMGEAAPYLMLPIAYGLLNSQTDNPTSQPSQGAMGSYPMNNGYIPRQPIIPQYFGQSKTAKHNLSSLVTGAIIDNQLNKKPVSVATKQENTIQAEDERTKKLLSHPAVKEYVDSLINN